MTREVGYASKPYVAFFFHLRQVRMADDFDVEAMLEAPYKKVG